MNVQDRTGDPPDAPDVLAAPTDSRQNAVPGDRTTPREVGGRGGLDPTRYGDWEMRGRCVDF